MGEAPSPLGRCCCEPAPVRATCAIPHGRRCGSSQEMTLALRCTCFFTLRSAARQSWRAPSRTSSQPLPTLDLPVRPRLADSACFVAAPSVAAPGPGSLAQCTLLIRVLRDRSALLYDETARFECFFYDGNVLLLPFSRLNNPVLGAGCWRSHAQTRSPCAASAPNPAELSRALDEMQRNGKVD